MTVNTCHLKQSRVDPKFLHSNSTSHSWVFSAIAELVDNAVDPDCAAKRLDIDHDQVPCGNQALDCLIFTDNGNGMTPEKLHNMLSFGFCDKESMRDLKFIGHYGNGFKSGSMRIGKDALVFTKTKADNGLEIKSLGMLSQTFLKAVNAETVVLPICSWENDKLVSDKATQESLTLILHYCQLFTKEQDLLNQFQSIMKHGTKIIIYNLKKMDENDLNSGLELDFESDHKDIRNSETLRLEGMSAEQRMSLTDGSSPCEHRKSLAAYLSILYMKPKLLIYIRGYKVHTALIQKSIKGGIVEYYTPKLTDGNLDETKSQIAVGIGYRVVVSIGLSTLKSKEYGAMLYHHNRLIAAYEKLIKDDKAAGVLLIAEVNHLEPNHIKQEFIQNVNFRNCITNLTAKLRDYVNLVEGGDGLQINSQSKKWDWVMCDLCLKWRRLPDSIDVDSLSKKNVKWYCRNNPDQYFNRCDIPEESLEETCDIQLQTQQYKEIKNSKKRKSLCKTVNTIIPNSTRVSLIEHIRQHDDIRSSRTRALSPSMLVEVKEEESNYVLGPPVTKKPRSQREKVTEQLQPIMLDDDDEDDENSGSVIFLEDEACTTTKNANNNNAGPSTVVRKVIRPNKVQSTSAAATATISETCLECFSKSKTSFVTREVQTEESDSKTVSLLRHTNTLNSLRSLRLNILTLLSAIVGDNNSNSASIPDVPDQSVDALVEHLVQSQSSLSD